MAAENRKPDDAPDPAPEPYRAENIGTKEVESILRHEIDNWILWGRKRDWMPVGFRCPLGFRFRSNDNFEASYRPPSVHDGNAARFERIVIRLPLRHREAWVMHQMDRAHVRGRVVIVHGRNDKARLMGLQKSRYHELVGEAFNMIMRQWRLNFG